MQWRNEAEKKLMKVPFFVRGLARKETERLALERRISVVTPALVDEAKELFLRRRSTRSRQGPDQMPELSGAATAESDEPRTLEDLVERAIETAESMSVKNRYFEVAICGAPAGCPFALTEGTRLLERMVQAIEASKWSDRLKKDVVGPILTHHKFRAAIAGCPNGCSEPQIKDFAAVAVSIPKRGEGECTGCGECVRACPDGLVTLADDGPIINRISCLDCGRCAAACQDDSLVNAKAGFKVLAGGRLGRRPHLAETLPGIYTEDQVVDLLSKALGFAREYGRPGERLGGILERLGMTAKVTLL